MGLYIEGMEMPTRCCECRLSTCHSFKERPLCDVLVEYMSYGEWEAKRLDNCPLVPIPKHGRLIDADALLNLLNHCIFPSDMVTTTAVRMATNWIKDAPTIIETEVNE